MRWNVLWCCLLASLAALGGCGSGPSGPGAKLYSSQGCGACHGPSGEGLQVGPPLRGLGKDWTAEDLAEYLAEPKRFVDSSERLQGLKKKYAMQMPAVNLPVEQRRVLAEHVLGF